MKTLIDNLGSSSVEAFEYDSEEKSLKVEFVNGTIYDYYEVPEDVFEALCESESKGQYLNVNIKGSYNYEKASN